MQIAVIDVPSLQYRENTAFVSLTLGHEPGAYDKNRTRVRYKMRKRFPPAKEDTGENLQILNVSGLARRK